MSYKDNVTKLDVVEIESTVNCPTEEQLKKTVNKMVVFDKKSRTFWINGMPFGNKYYPVSDGNIDATLYTNGSEVFNDFDNNQANGEYSHAEGKGTIVNNTAEHGCGMFNTSVKSTDADKSTLFSIGNGSDDSHRSNAIEVKKNGDVYINGVGENDSSKHKPLQESIYYVDDVDNKDGGILMIEFGK